MIADRPALMPEFRKAGLDPAKIVVNGAEAGEQYRQAASYAVPSLEVSVMKPGEQRVIAL